MAVERHRLGQRRHDALGQDRDVGGAADVGHQHGELVAAEPRHRVELAHAGAQPLGAGLEQPVARRVAERVVDLLEAVEVEAQDRRLGAAPPPALGGLGERVAQPDPVRQAGQAVVLGEEAGAGDRLDLGRGVGGDPR